MKLLSIREAAKRLGVHPNRLREWEKKGIIQGFQELMRRGREA